VKIVADENIDREIASQRELAKRLGVPESQVSRDERNEYFGITLERAVRILDALGVKLHTRVEIEPPLEPL
jgi:transcriptional regulator with XRE-family HTH domain